MTKQELPKNLVVDHGYLQVRIMHKGRIHCKNFGPISPETVLLAKKYAAETKLKIRLGLFGIKPEHPSLKFKDVAPIYFDLWKKEIYEGKLKHSEQSIKNTTYTINSLVETFGYLAFDDVKPADVLKWFERRSTVVSPTTATREKKVLSSLFSHISDWVKQERINPIRLPSENPCATIEGAKTRRRERIVTREELKALKQACFDLKDESAWTIITLAIRSLLRRKDLMRLESGESIDLIQAKTRVRIRLPVQILHGKEINWVNFRKRWETIRALAKLDFPRSDPRHLEFRDLRRTAANFLKGLGHSQRLIGEMLGHSQAGTTDIYLMPEIAHLKPLAEDLERLLSSL